MSISMNKNSVLSVGSTETEKLRLASSSCRKLWTTVMGRNQQLLPLIDRMCAKIDGHGQDGPMSGGGIRDLMDRYNNDKMSFLSIMSTNMENERVQLVHQAEFTTELIAILRNAPMIPLSISEPQRTVPLYNHPRGETSYDTMTKKVFQLNRVVLPALQQLRVFLHNQNKESVENKLRPLVKGITEAYEEHGSGPAVNEAFAAVDDLLQQLQGQTDYETDLVARLSDFLG